MTESQALIAALAVVAEHNARLEGLVTECRAANTQLEITNRELRATITGQGQEHRELYAELMKYRQAEAAKHHACAERSIDRLAVPAMRSG